LSIALPPVGLYKAIRESHRFGFASLPRLFEIQVSSPWRKTTHVRPRRPFQFGSEDFRAKLNVVGSPLRAVKFPEFLLRRINSPSAPNLGY